MVVNILDIIVAVCMSNVRYDTLKCKSEIVNCVVELGEKVTNPKQVTKCIDKGIIHVRSYKNVGKI